MEGADEHTHNARAHTPRNTHTNDTPVRTCVATCTHLLPYAHPRPQMEQLLLLFNERFERIETLIGPAPAADATAAADKSEGRDEQRRKLARK